MTKTLSEAYVMFNVLRPSLMSCSSELFKKDKCVKHYFIISLPDIFSPAQKLFRLYFYLRLLSTTQTLILPKRKKDKGKKKNFFSKVLKSDKAFSFFVLLRFRHELRCGALAVTYLKSPGERRQILPRLKPSTVPRCKVRCC